MESSQGGEHDDRPMKTTGEEATEMHGHRLSTTNDAGFDPSPETPSPRARSSLNGSAASFAFICAQLASASLYPYNGF